MSPPHCHLIWSSSKVSRVFPLCQLGWRHKTAQGAYGETWQIAIIWGRHQKLPKITWRIQRKEALIYFMTMTVSPWDCSNRRKPWWERKEQFMVPQTLRVRRQDTVIRWHAVRCKLKQTIKWRFCEEAETGISKMLSVSSQTCIRWTYRCKRPSTNDFRDFRMPGKLGGQPVCISLQPKSDGLVLDDIIYIVLKKGPSWNPHLSVVGICILYI